MLGKWFPTFERHTSPSSSRIYVMWDLEPLEDEGELFLPHVGNHLLSNAA